MSANDYEAEGKLHIPTTHVEFKQTGLKKEAYLYLRNTKEIEKLDLEERSPLGTLGPILTKEVLRLIAEFSRFEHTPEEE